MSLYLRISDTDLHFAKCQGKQTDEFQFETFHVRPQASLTANVREAMAQVSLLSEPYDRVEALINAMVTPVPLAEFQEEDAEATWKFCFTHNEHERVFYDPAPATNIVLLYAFAEATCHTLEDAFGHVHYTAALTAVVQHFATKALAVSQGKRMFVNMHDGSVDALVFEDTRLLMLNTYAVRTLSDVAYYTLNLARHVGVDITTAPIFVSGSEELIDSVVGELQKYAARVYAVNPAAEFNRHPASTTQGVPYDLRCALLK